MTQQPYAWAIDGCERMWAGTYAEIDAKAEARRCGGTCKAFGWSDPKMAMVYFNPTGDDLAGKLT